MGCFTRDPFAAFLHRARPEVVALAGLRDGGAEALDLRATYRPSILHAFEPDPARMPLCRAALGRVPGLVLHPFGLWERPGRTALPGREGTDAGASVRMAVLANAMAAEGLPRIDLLCLDAGAAALPALRGAGARLRRDVRLVLARVPTAAAEGVEAFLAGAGFRRLAAARDEDGSGRVALLHEGAPEAAPPAERPAASGPGFLRRFDREWAPRLMDRAATFREAFARLLDAGPADPRILEFGCLRLPDGVVHGAPAPPDHPWEWGGLSGPWSEGCSTLLFDRFAEACGGRVVSVDRDPAACAVARAATSAATTSVLTADSVAAIEGGAAASDPATADLVYLDTFGAGPEAPDRHRREIEALWPLLRPGALLLVDDVRDPSAEGDGTGPGERVVGAFLRARGLAPVVEGPAQALWRKA